MPLKNKKEKREYQKQWRKNNPERIREYQKRSCERKKEWAKNNPEKVRESSIRYRKNNPEKCKESSRWCAKRRRKKYPEKIKEIKKRYCKNHQTDLKFNLNGRMKDMTNHSLKSNKAGRHWELIVGYNLADLIKRLNKTMPVGYTWKDYLQGKLHIDHIIPISVFNFSKPEHTDFKRCWALSNLRLLPAKDNLIKGAKLDRPFQPALKM